MSIRDGKLIYHLVPLDSLKSIINHGLMSRDKLDEIKINFIDTADQEILHERERLGLSQYVPFHFHIHTAYDTAVKNLNSDKVFVYICLHRDFARINNFKVLPIHPASNEQPELLDYDEGFKRIDWNIMELTKAEAQDAGIDLRYHKQVKMAECLAPSSIPVNCFQSINVPNKEIEKIVIKLLCAYNIIDRPHIDIRNWFV